MFDSLANSHYSYGRVPIDSYTKLLLHMSGADESTTFTDNGITGHTVTAEGNAQIDTAQSKFGYSSGLFDGTGDYIDIPDHADWDFGANPFTIDFWVRFNSVVSSQTFYSQRVDATHRVLLYWHSDGAIIYYSNNGSYSISFNGSWSPSVNIWYHTALIRGWGGVTGDFALCIDGNAVGTDSDIDTVADVAANVNIGRAYADTDEFNGWIDEFRVSQGVARWTENFNPPIRAH